MPPGDGVNGDRSQLLAEAARFIAHAAVDHDDAVTADLANRLAAEADDAAAPGRPSVYDEVQRILTARR